MRHLFVRKCKTSLCLHREYRYKDNVSMVDESNKRVSAYNVKRFVFLRDKSVGDPAVDSITTVNIPAWVSLGPRQVRGGNGNGAHVLFMVSHIPPSSASLSSISSLTSCLQAVMNKVKESFFRSSMVSIWMNSLKSGLFTTRTVDELLWGYEDPLLARISPSNPEVEKVFGLMYKASIPPAGLIKKKKKKGKGRNLFMQS